MAEVLDLNLDEKMSASEMEMYRQSAIRGLRQWDRGSERLLNRPYKQGI